MKKSLSISLFVLLAIPFFANAAIIVDSAYWDGSRSSSDTSQIFATASGNKDWTNGGFKIDWDITQTGSIYTYTYGITTTALSNWILEITQPSELTDFNFDPGPVPDDGIFSGTPNVEGAPGSIYGLKWNTNDVNSFSVTFSTSKEPVWGDLWAKDGGGTGSNAVIAYNVGFGNDPTTNDFNGWIPTPDNGAPVPIPAAIWLLGGGLVGLVAIRRKRR